ncbi:MAG: metallophosphoesterase [Acutalibacteraceae bacterium]
MKTKTKRLLSLLLCLALILASGAVCAFAENESSEITRISCTISGDSKTQRGFCWYTKEQTDSIVRIFKNGVDVSDTLSFTDIQCEKWGGEYMHKVTVKGLTPGTGYTYLVGDGASWGKEGKFTTDDGGNSFSFISVADVQASSLESFEKSALVLDAAFEKDADPDFVVNLGDFTNDSTNEEWDYYFSAFERHNTAATLVPVAGNHDGLGVWHWFNNMFNLDTSESVQTLNGVNYSFDYANAHFAVLNTNDVLSISQVQLNWLKNDMNSSDADWKIVFMHKSPYSLGKDGKWPDALYLSEALTAVLDECSVDLVMSGHDHMYLRTKALKGNKIAEDSQGTRYILAGTAGTKRYEIRDFSAGTYLNLDFIDALTVQKDGYGNYWNGTDYNSTDPENIGGCFSTVSIDGGKLNLNAYILSDETGNVKCIDSLTLEKETGKGVKTFDGDNTTSKLDYALDVIPSFVHLANYAVFNWLFTTLKNLPKIILSVLKTGTF